MTTRVGIALGSNLGDSAALIAGAIGMLKQLAISTAPFLEGGVYRTPPVDCPPGSPDFLNTVVEFSYTGSPHRLLAATRAIETSLGRERGGLPRNSPRPIDLDILYFGDVALSEPELTIPHPRMTTRAFVLHPLADIRPDLILPGEKMTISALLAAMS